MQRNPNPLIATNLHRARHAPCAPIHLRGGGGRNPLAALTLAALLLFAALSTADAQRDSGLPRSPTNRYIQISAGNDYTCTLRGTGAAHCWGSASRYDHAAVPEGRYTAIDAGNWHACAIRESGEAVCWGASSDAPQGVFTRIGVGWHYACGLRENGAAECWGTSGYGRSVLDYGQATAPSGTFTAISAGYLHTCGLREDGAIACWGLNNYG